MVYPVTHKLELEIYKSIENPARPYNRYRDTAVLHKNSEAFDAEKYPQRLVELANRPLKEYSIWVNKYGRICTRCKVYKTRDEIYQLKSRCKKCRREYHRKQSMLHYYNNKK